MIVQISQVTVETNDAIKTDEYQVKIRAGNGGQIETGLGGAQAIMRALEFVLAPGNSRGLFQ